MEAFFRRRRVTSIPTIYSIINVCHKVDYEHNFFYKFIEKAIADHLSSHPNYYIPEKDIKFLNVRLAERGLCSKNFKLMIDNTLSNPKDWPIHRAKYLEREQAFKERNRKDRESK
jgi:hypothetical protein